MTSRDNVKVVLLGATGSGKTSLVHRYTQNEFTDENQTIGASFTSKTIEFSGRSVKMNVWDTAGQVRYRSLACMYYRDAQCCVLVYSVDSADSFQQAQDWYAEIMGNPGNPKPGTDMGANAQSPTCILVGNKADLEEKVPWSQAQTWAREHCVPLFMCSAKTGQGVALVFEECASSWLTRHRTSAS